MIINGNINKTLHLTVTGDGYSQSYDKAIGTAVYIGYSVYLLAGASGSDGRIQREFALQLRQYHPDKIRIGQHHVHPYGQRSREAYVREQRGGTAHQLAGQHGVQDYAIYDGPSALTEARFSITRGGMEVYSSENDAIVANARNTFTYPMEVETDDDADFGVTVGVTDGADALTEPSCR